MGIYIFNTDVLLPALMKDAEDPTRNMTSGTTFCPDSWAL